MKKGETLPQSWELVDESHFYGEGKNGEHLTRLVLIQHTKYTKKN